MWRTLVRALALTLLLAMTLDAGVALAQPLPITPGGTIVSSSASETCVNTAGECQVFQYTIPAAMTATFTNPLANVSQWLDGATPTGFHGPVIWTTPQPLHLKMIGSLANAAGDNLAIGVNFGGSVGVQPLVATMYISNTIVTAAGPRPAYLDVWIVPIASTSATPSGTSTVGQINYTMIARLEFGTAIGGATPTIISSQTFSSSNLGSATQINVLTRWGAASNASSIAWIRRILKLGE
jgi:hypothetical protein